MKAPGKNEQIRAIVRVCRRMADTGHVVATEGNVSARFSTGNILLTGHGVTKGNLTKEDLVVLDPSGEKLSGKRDPSSEVRMHLYIYKRRPDVGAVVHAHPPGATAFAVAGVPLPVNALPEVIVEFGTVPLVRYGTPSTAQVTRAIARHLKQSDAFLLANHGIVVCGNDPDDAFAKLERIEHAARIILAARLLGGEKLLTARQIRELVTTAGASRRRKGERS